MNTKTEAINVVRDSLAKGVKPKGSLFHPPVSNTEAHGRIEETIRTVIREDPPLVLIECRSSADHRDQLDISNQGDFFDWLAENLGVSATLPGMFRRGGRLVRVPRIGEEGWIPREPGDGDDGPAQVRELTDVGLMGIVQSRYWVCKEKREIKADADSCTGERETITRTHALLSSAICRVPVDGPDEFPKLPNVRGVTHTPMLRADGTELKDPGYDVKSEMLYLPDPGFVVADHPSLGSVREEWRTYSKDFLSYLLVDFPFENELHRLNYLALLLTPLMRAVCPPPYPMWIINAHQRGTGKSLLAKIAREIHGGVHRPELPTESDEIRKQITSILTTTTAPIINFDNVTQPIRNGLIANLLTTATWSDRPLGRTGTVHAVNDRLWVANGNNVEIGGDLARRIRTVTLETNWSNPEYRTGFRQNDLIGYVRANRGAIVAALLAQLLWWVQRGMPVRELRSDDYAGWEGAMTEILEGGGLDEGGVFALGERGVSGGMVTSTDEDDLGVLLGVFAERFGGNPFQLKDVQAYGESLAGAEIMKDALPAECIVTRGGDPWKVLGHYLNKKKKTPGGGYRLNQLPEKRRRAWVYQLETVTTIPVSGPS